MADQVRYISSSGSDSADGLASSTPWLTTAGVSAVAASLGDLDTLTVYVKEGETINHSSTLTVSNNHAITVTFDTYGGIGQGRRAFINWTGGNTAQFTISGDFSSNLFGFAFNNLDITGNNTSADIINVDTAARCFVTLNNCRLHHTSQGQVGATTAGRGIFMNATSFTCTLTVRDSRLEFLGTDGISAFGSNTMSVYNSTFKNLGDLVFGGGQGDGITTHTASTAEVYDCYFEKCAQGGCYFTNMTGTNKVVRSFFRDCAVVCLTQSTGAGSGTGGKTIASHCVLIQPDTAFQLDDFGNGQTQFTSTVATPCAGTYGTTSATNKDNTLKLYNCTMWSGYRGSVAHVVQVGDVAGSYHVFDMRNCLVMGKASGTNQRLVSILPVAGLTTITMDYNTYWCASSSIPFRINYGSGVNGTFADWQGVAAVSGGNWLDLDNNSTFYTGAADNTTSANHIYGLPAYGTAPVSITNLYLHPLNTSGKVGNTTGVDALHTGLIATTTIDGRYQQFSTNAFYRGALGPLRVNQ